MYFRGINLPPEGYLYTKRRIWCIDSRLRVLYSGEGKIATEHSSQHRIGLILKFEILTLFFFSVSLLFSMFPVWYQLRGLALRAFVSNFCSSFPPPSPHLPKNGTNLTLGSFHGDFPAHDYQINYVATEMCPSFSFWFKSASPIFSNSL